MPQTLSGAAIAFSLLAWHLPVVQQNALMHKWFVRLARRDSIMYVQLLPLSLLASPLPVAKQRILLVKSLKRARLPPVLPARSVHELRLSRLPCVHHGLTCMSTSDKECTQAVHSQGNPVQKTLCNDRVSC